MSDNNELLLTNVMLANISGDVGCVIRSDHSRGAGGRDYLLQLDLPLEEVYKVSYKIPTSEVKYALELQYHRYLHMVSEVKQLAEEITKYSVAIQADVDTLNAKYSEVELINVVFDIDQTHIINAITSFTTYISSHAVLYVMDIEKFVNMNIDLGIIFDYYKKLNPNDGRLIISPDNYREFGDEARGGESIFDRVAHHYAVLREDLFGDQLYTLVPISTSEGEPHDGGPVEVTYDYNNIQEYKE